MKAAHLWSCRKCCGGDPRLGSGRRRQKVHLRQFPVQTGHTVTRWRRVQNSGMRPFPLSAWIYLINGFSQHLPHKLKQLQVVLVDVGCRWRIKPFISTCSLRKYNRANRIKLGLSAGYHVFIAILFWLTLNRLRAGLNTFLMISSRNSLNTPSWSIPASSTPRSLTNLTRMTPFIKFAGRRRSWSYPSLEQQKCHFGASFQTVYIISDK